MHSCCIQLLLLDFLERCEQPICSATSQLKWFSEQKHINSIGWNQKQKNRTKTLYSKTDSWHVFLSKQGLCCYVLHVLHSLPPKIICVTPIRLNFTTSSSLLFKNPRRLERLVFLGRLADGTHSDQILRLKWPRPDPPGDDLSQWPPCQPMSTPGQRTATETRHRQANFVVDHCDVRSLPTLAMRKQNMANLSSSRRASLRESWNYPFQRKCWARLGIQVLSAHGIQLPSTPPFF